jgi:hypothetical protein
MAALLRILAGCAARGGRIPAVVFDRRATKHPAKIRAALRVGAAAAPQPVAGSLNRSSAIRLAREGGEAKAGASLTRLASHPAALQRCYPSLRLGALTFASQVKKQRRQSLEALPTRVHGKAGCLLSDFEDWLNFRQQWVDNCNSSPKKVVAAC